ncbi:MAG: hypothetical protein ACI4NR_07010 [Megasphaera sp.]|uniref:hypothetical protein n=1 Tax=Megasphaera sp. TaxID=2023260 RepID=UPI003F0E7F26
MSQVQADTVNLSSDRETDLKNGNLTAVTLKLKAGGSIKQTAAHAIAAKTVSIEAGSGIALDSGAGLTVNPKFNSFENVTLNNASEATDIVLGNGGDEDLTVTFADGSKAKDVIVRNYANGEANDLDINGPIAAAAGIALINDEGSLATTGGLDAKADIRETAKGSLNNSDALHAEQDIVLTATDGSIINDAAITAKRNVTMKAAIPSRTVPQQRPIPVRLNNGSILFQGVDNATTEDIHLTAQNGDLFLHVSRTGDIKDSHRSVNGDRAFLTAANGNLTIRHDGTGDGDLYSGVSI